MKRTTFDVYFIQSNAVLQTESGENAEESEVYRDGEERWEQDEKEGGETWEKVKLVTQI